MHELLETLIEEFFTTIELAKNSTYRATFFPKAKNIIKVAIGMRRSGKTYLLYQTINQLLQKGITKQQILFINFEDDRLLPMNAKEMGKLLDDFYSLYPENHTRECYIFLDEVQNIPDWHLVVRRYFDSKNVQIYLTGSSAKLLSKEINTSLRGRSLTTEVLPYSFQEYLLAHGKTVKGHILGKASFDILQRQLLNYFATGGFPAVQFIQHNEWLETLQTYVDTVILRDIIERHNVTNIALLKYLTKTLLKNAATAFSVNKFYNDIKSQGYRVSKDTLHNYLSYIQDSFLIFIVPYYSESERLMQNRPKKIYAIDSGLIKAFSAETNHTYGKLLENLVYLDLRRQGKTIYFYNTTQGYEIDFITVDKNGAKELVQVAWDDTDPAVLSREMRALTQAEKELGIRGRLVTVREYLKNLKALNKH